MKKTLVVKMRVLVKEKMTKHFSRGSMMMETLLAKTIIGPKGLYRSLLYQRMSTDLTFVKEPLVTLLPCMTEICVYIKKMSCKTCWTEGKENFGLKFLFYTVRLEYQSSQTNWLWQVDPFSWPVTWWMLDPTRTPALRGWAEVARRQVVRRRRRRGRDQDVGRDIVDEGGVKKRPVFQESAPPALSGHWTPARSPDKAWWNVSSAVATGVKRRKILEIGYETLPRQQIVGVSACNMLQVSWGVANVCPRDYNHEDWNWFLTHFPR